MRHCMPAMLRSRISCSVTSQLGIQSLSGPRTPGINLPSRYRGPEATVGIGTRTRYQYETRSPPFGRLLLGTPMDGKLAPRRVTVLRRIGLALLLWSTVARLWCITFRTDERT
jgi:hypothetical protein